MTYDAGNLCDNDMIMEFQKHGVCEPETVLAMQRIVREGDTVIDGGANIGFFTIFLAQLVGPGGKVFAIEPGENNIWKLEENVRINKLKQVEIVRKALWCNHDRVTLYMRHESGWNSLSPADGYRGAAQVETCMLSDFPQPRLIKLDIEGAEGMALTTVPRITDFIICEINETALGNLGCSQDQLRTMMKDYGTFLLRSTGQIPVWVPPKTKITTTKLNTNVLFARMNEIAAAWPEVSE